MLKNVVFVCAAVAFAFAPATAQAPDQAKVIAGAERAIEKHAKMSPPNAPGCAVGVSLDGKPVVENSRAIRRGRPRCTLAHRDCAICRL